MVPQAEGSVGSNSRVLRVGRMVGGGGAGTARPCRRKTTRFRQLNSHVYPTGVGGSAVDECAEHGRRRAMVEPPATLGVRCGGTSRAKIGETTVVLGKP